MKPSSLERICQMVRSCAWVVAAGLLAWAGSARAADSGLAGKWKLELLVQGQHATVWLIRLDTKEGKTTGSILAAAEGFPGDASVENVRVADGTLHFGVKLEGQTWTFDGKLPDGNAPVVRGVVDLGGKGIMPAHLERTSLTGLDSYELAKETLAKKPNDAQLFEAALNLLKQAGAKKATPEEVRGWAERAFKAADAYGPRWQEELALRMAEALAFQPGLAPVAVEYARRAERLMPQDGDAATRLRTLKALSTALKRADKEAEAKGIDAQIDKLDLKAYEDYARKALPFKPETFAGRKDSSTRVVLVELFTGAQCPPCVAADLAFDALGKTYKPTEVALLQYHIHVPRFDPLANPDSEARQRYYSDAIQGTPTILFDGKAEAGGGGFVDDAKDKYKEYREVLDPLLNAAPRAKIKASAVQKGGKIDITAEVTDLEEPGDRTRLRLALVEDWAQYQGANRLRYHHHVVRAMPGGGSGLALKDKTGKLTTSIDLEELRKELNRYLDSRKFPEDRPSVDLKRLSVVAFVQNDKTKEILQSAQVPVQTEGAAK
jgi:hypothetical protein